MINIDNRNIKLVKKKALERSIKYKHEDSALKIIKSNQNLFSDFDADNILIEAIDNNLDKIAFEILENITISNEVLAKVAKEVCSKGKQELYQKIKFIKNNNELYNLILLSVNHAYDGMTNNKEIENIQIPNYVHHIPLIKDEVCEDSDSKLLNNGEINLKSVEEDLPEDIEDNMSELEPEFIDPELDSKLSILLRKQNKNIENAEKYLMYDFDSRIDELYSTLKKVSFSDQDSFLINKYYPGIYRVNFDFNNPHELLYYVCLISNIYTLTPHPKNLSPSKTLDIFYDKDKRKTMIEKSMKKNNWFCMYLFIKIGWDTRIYIDMADIYTILSSKIVPNLLITVLDNLLFNRYECYQKYIEYINTWKRNEKKRDVYTFSFPHSHCHYLKNFKIYFSYVLHKIRLIHSLICGDIREDYLIYGQYLDIKNIIINKYLSLYI